MGSERIRASDLRQLVRFGAAGSVNASATYGVYLLLLFVDVHYLAASLLAFIGWFWFGYSLQSIWVFGSRKNRKNFARYLVVQLLSAPFSLALLALMVEVANIRAEISQLITIAITALVTFLSSRFFVFVSEVR